MTDFSKTPLIDLLNIIDIAVNDNNQILINAVVVEFTRRFYHPATGKTKEEFMAELGYKEIKVETKDKPKTFVKRRK